jgi:hypothetical protein
MIMKRFRLHKGAAVCFSVTFLRCLTIAVLLSGCVVVRAEQAEARLKEMVTSLPEPSEVDLVDEVKGISGGSDKACYTAYLYRLYGTDLSPEDVFAFYENMLISKGGWTKNEERSSDQRLAFYNYEDGFRLSINRNPGSQNRFPDESMTRAEQQFEQVFIVAATHADLETRKRCWVEWER